MDQSKIYQLFKEKLDKNLKSIVIKEFFEDTNYIEQQQQRIIISFNSFEDRDKFISQNAQLKVLDKFSIIPSASLEISPTQFEEILTSELVKRIEEDQKLYLSILEVKEIIKLDQFRASQISFYGKGIKIGIIDNGINPYHDSITDIILEQYQIQDDSFIKYHFENSSEITHGTLMANVIGNQYLDYEENYVGIAPNVKIIDLNIARNENEFYMSDVIKALDFINSNGLEINMILISLSSLDPSDGNDILSMVCNELSIKKKIKIVVPAGNFGPESNTIGTPGASAEAITVGSLTKDSKVSYFSGRGPTLDGRLKPDLCFPGSKIEIPLNNDIKIQLSGTSVAAAICTGILALFLEFKSDYSIAEFKRILEKLAPEESEFNISQGYGFFDVITLFKQQDLFHKPLILYPDLVKKSIWFTIEFILILLFSTYIIFNFLNPSNFLLR